LARDLLIRVLFIYGAINSINWIKINWGNGNEWGGRIVIDSMREKITKMPLHHWVIIEHCETFQRERIAGFINFYLAERFMEATVSSGWVGSKYMIYIVSNDAGEK
jgi:hypothetical protein